MKTRWKGAGWNYHWISNPNVQKQHWVGIAFEIADLQVHVVRAISAVFAVQTSLFPQADSSPTHQKCVALIQMAPDHLERFLVCSSVTFYKANVFVARTENWSAAPRLSSASVDVQSVSVCRSRWFRKLHTIIRVDKLQLLSGQFLCCWRSCVVDAVMICTY